MAATISVPAKHYENILNELKSFRKQELFADSTIVCKDKQFSVHRLVLSSCSSYFKEIFEKTQCCHPVLIMNEIEPGDLEVLLNYMYEGRAKVSQEKLSFLIKEGQALKIKGFTVSELNISIQPLPGVENDNSYSHEPPEYARILESNNNQNFQSVRLREELQHPSTSGEPRARRLPEETPRQLSPTVQKRRQAIADIDAIIKKPRLEDRSQSENDSESSHLDSHIIDRSSRPTQIVPEKLQNKNSAVPQYGTYSSFLDFYDDLDPLKAEIETYLDQPNPNQSNNNSSLSLTKRKPTEESDYVKPIEQVDVKKEVDSSYEDYTKDNAISVGSSNSMDESRASHNTRSDMNSVNYAGMMRQKLADPLMNSKESDLSLQKFLNKLGLDELVKRFQDEKIDMSSLKLMGKEHIEKLVPCIGQQVKLWHALQSPRKGRGVHDELEERGGYPLAGGYHGGGGYPGAGSGYSGPEVGFLPPHGLSQDPITSVQTTEEWQREQHALPIPTRSKKTHSAVQMNLRQLLMQSTQGQLILDFYINNKRLEGSLRKRMVGLIIEHAMNQSPNLRDSDFKMFAEQITDLFPTEDPSFYYLSCSERQGKCSSGKLVIKYKNSRSKLISLGLIEKDSPKNYQRYKRNEPSLLAPQAEVEEEIRWQAASPDLEEDLSWLQTNDAPWMEVVTRWERTAQYRLRNLAQFEGSVKFGMIRNKWPIIEGIRGNQLIEIDFSKKYPGKEDAFALAWPELAKKLVYLISDKFRTDNRTQLVLQTICSEAARDLFLLQTIHRLLPPQMINVKKSEGKKWRPSVVESQETFVIVVEDPTSVEERIKAKKEQLAQRNLTLQPVIIVLRDQYQVYVDGIFYEYTDLISATSFLFKVYTTYNIPYPKISLSFWLFIQTGVYKIRTPFDVKNSSVLGLIADLDMKE